MRFVIISLCYSVGHDCYSVKEYVQFQVDGNVKIGYDPQLALKTTVASTDSEGLEYCFCPGTLCNEQKIGY